MTITFREPYQDLTFMSPLSNDRADALATFLATDLDGTVLDVGCGWAELLLRVVVAAPSARGVGYDLNQAAIEHGRHIAEERRIGDRVVLHVEDARNRAESVDAVICIGASQIWGPPGEENLPLDYAAALHAIRSMVPRGGRVVFGEAIWSGTPTAAAAAPLSGRLDEFVALGSLIDIAVAEGFMPVEVHEATQDEWDEFESGYSARYAHWLAEHGPDHPGAADIRKRAARQREAYFGGYRGVLGMAYLGLLAV